MAGRTTPRKNADEGDQFEMVHDGTCRLTVGDVTVRFRRPRFGEFRDRRQALEERDDQSLVLSAAATEKAKQIRLDAGMGENETEPAAASSTEQAQVALAVRGVMRELNDTIVEMNMAWVLESLEGLRVVDTDEIPDTETWPTEMGDSQFLKDLVAHWRHRPLARGGGAPQTS